MDHRNSSGRSGDTYRQAADARSRAESVQLDPGAVGLSDSAPDRHWSVAAPGTAETLRCRQLLDRLLRIGWPAQASAWAGDLIAEFGSISGVFAADSTTQARVLGDNRAAARFLATVRSVMLRALENDALSGPVLSTSQQLVDYLRADMAHAPVERFRVLFLNTQNRLLCQTVTDGSVNEAPIYPREIVRRALEVGATALILAHNHPSGDARPSRSD